MKKPIATLIAAAGLMVAFAETSTNTSPSTKAAEVKYPWASTVSAGISITRGNSHTSLFTADYLTAKKTPNNEYSFGVGIAYGTQNSADTANSYKVFAQWNHLFTERFYGYLRADALRDLVADLDYRLTIGPGVGYYLIKDTNTLLAAEAGGAVELQRLGGEDKQFATVRLAERFEHKFNDRARLWQSVELLPQVDKLENYIINFQIGIEAAISKQFSLKTYLDDTYANRPASDRQKNDVKIIAGVSYKF